MEKSLMENSMADTTIGVQSGEANPTAMQGSSLQQIYEVRLEQAKFSGKLDQLDQKQHDQGKQQDKILTAIEEIKNKMVTKDDMATRQQSIDEIKQDFKENETDNKQSFNSLQKSFSDKFDEWAKKFDAQSGVIGTGLIQTSVVTTKVNVVWAIISVVGGSILTWFIARMN